MDEGCRKQTSRCSPEVAQEFGPIFKIAMTLFFQMRSSFGGIQIRTPSGQRRVLWLHNRFRVRIRCTARPAVWAYLCTHTSIEHGVVDDIVLGLLRLAQQLDGDYDGWETPMVTQ